MRRRAVRAIGAALMVAGTVLALSNGAAAERPDQTGWWDRIKPDLPDDLGNPIPPPPDVPDEGLLVARDPLGPQAVAALRFIASKGVPATLTLRTTAPGAASGAAIDACPIEGVWDAAEDGLWDNRPTAACATAHVRGVSEVGTDVVTWAITPAFFRGDIPYIDIALVPAADDPAPFRVAFQPPADDALVAAGPLYKAPELPSNETLPPPLPPEELPEPVAPPAAPTGPAITDGTLPPTGPATTFAVPTTVADQVALPALASPDDSGDRLLAGVLLGVLGAGLVAGTARPPRSPKLIGGLARTEAEPD